MVQQISSDKVIAASLLEKDELPWHKQSSVLGFTFGECSAELLKNWQLPFTIIEPIRNQDNDDFQYSSDESKLLYLAKRIMLCNTNKAYPTELLLTEDALKQLPIDQNMLTEVSNFCDLERLGILSILNPSAAMIY